MNYVKRRLNDQSESKKLLLMVHFGDFNVHRIIMVKMKREEKEKKQMKGKALDRESSHLLGYPLLVK